MPAIEVICLVEAAFLLISIFASKLSNRVGVPALLFFLLIGSLGAQLGGLELTNPEIAKFIGDFAPIFILFTGGLDTHWPQCPRASPGCQHCAGMADLQQQRTAGGQWVFGSLSGRTRAGQSPVYPAANHCWVP